MSFVMMALAYHAKMEHVNAPLILTGRTQNAVKKLVRNSFIILKCLLYLSLY
jgi:hypothetical protein